ncbi:MAG TPA: hypothetical protein VGK32_14035 [Vicinamibacterales bacterium]
MTLVAIRPAIAAPQAPVQAPAAEHAQPAPETAGPPAGRGAQAGEPHKTTEAAGSAEHAGGRGAKEHGEETSESIWAPIARLFNFAVLAGVLIYLLRSPFATYLQNRGVTIRSDLKKAADMRAEAAAALEQIDARLKALPAELDALKRRGLGDIKAEEVRIRELAALERQRMLDQTRREIDTQLRIAERDLKKRVGELAVSVATERVRRTITDEDQTRLIDRYVTQVRH